MDLEKRSQRGIDVVRLAYGSVENANRVLAALHIDDLGTERDHVSTYNLKKFKRSPLVVKFAKFLRVESGAHDDNFERIEL